MKSHKSRVRVELKIIERNNNIIMPNTLVGNWNDISHLSSGVAVSVTTSVLNTGWTSFGMGVILIV
jgi:hypothetical protein